MKKRNFVRLVFCEPVIRALYPDRDRVAQTTLAQLRMAPVTRKTHGWPNCRTGQA
ncbi:MmyB family transcriptional regulator [Streptomyces sp. 900116325]